jgi:hypothetical protein
MLFSFCQDYHIRKIRRMKSDFGKYHVASDGWKLAGDKVHGEQPHESFVPAGRWKMNGDFRRPFRTGLPPFTRNECSCNLPASDLLWHCGLGDIQEGRL